MVGLLAAPAAALVTDFTWSPSDPVMGEIVTYTAVNNGYPYPITYKWEYKYTSGACQGTWVDSGFTSQNAYF